MKVLIPTTDEEVRQVESVQGLVRFSESLVGLEYFNGTEWIPLVVPGEVPLAVDHYIGDGIETAFTLSITPTSRSQILVFINGIYQSPLTNVNDAPYDLSGATLTFSSPAPLNTPIAVIHNTGKIN